MPSTAVILYPTLEATKGAIYRSSVITGDSDVLTLNKKQNLRLLWSLRL